MTKYDKEYIVLCYLNKMFSYFIKYKHVYSNFYNRYCSVPTIFNIYNIYIFVACSYSNLLKRTKTSSWNNDVNFTKFPLFKSKLICSINTSMVARAVSSFPSCYSIWILISIECKSIMNFLFIQSSSFDGSPFFEGESILALFKNTHTPPLKLTN